VWRFDKEAIDKWIAEEARMPKKKKD